MKTYTFNAKKLFPIYPVTVGFNFEQDDINRPLGVDMEQIFVVSGGHGSISIDGSRSALERGDMFFLSKGMAHSYSGDADFRTTFLGFDGELCRSIFEHYGVKSSSVYKGKNFELSLLQIKELYDGMESMTDSALLSANTYRTVAAFFVEALKKERTPTELVRDYLEASFGKPLMLADIMEFYPYSKAKLCRDFSARYGITIFEMLTKIRLDHARTMLKIDPCMKLKAVAAACGFNDTSYFCKMYKRVYGRTPDSERQRRGFEHKVDKTSTKRNEVTKANNS